MTNYLYLVFRHQQTADVKFIAPVYIIPGENEMQALADGAFRVLSGEENAKQYEEPSERPF